MADIYSLQFDEVITYLTSPSDSDWAMIRTSGSKAFLFWLNIADNSGAAFQYYYSTGGVADVGTFNAFTNESSDTYACRPQEANRGAVTAPQTFPSGWVLVCHQYNRDIFKWEMTIVPEGGLASRATAVDTLTYNQTLDAPNIGRRKDGNADRYYGGKVGAISVTPYNTLLTNGQLESLAASFLDYDPETEFTPVLHFPFNEGTGTSIVDTVKSLTLTGIGITGGDWVLEGSTGGGESITLDSGVYSQAGTSTPISAQLNITTTAGSYSLTGSLVNLRAAKTLIANTGSYNLTGTDVTLIYTPSGGGEILIVDSGVYSLAGGEVLLKADLNIITNSSNYSLSGANTIIRYGAAITADTSSYSLNGSNLNLFANYGMIVLSTSYTLTGTAVTLKYSGDVSQTIGTVTAGFAEDLYSAGYKPNTITVNFKG